MPRKHSVRKAPFPSLGERDMVPTQPRLRLTPQPGDLLELDCWPPVAIRILTVDEEHQTAEAISDADDDEAPMTFGWREFTKRLN